jgi:FtsP/CotA-like multicopper oxidase with cupredoxin domain
MSNPILMRRRQLLKAGAASAGLLALGSSGLLSARPLAQRLLLGGASAASLYVEAFPTSPLLLSPFTDPLPIPQALTPVPAAVWQNWTHWTTGRSIVPGPGAGQQDASGSTHQLWPSQLQYKGRALPDPLVYQIKVQLGEHRFTSSRVLPISSSGQPTVSYDAAGQSYAPGAARELPKSVIYGFNGTFPGPRINAEYGRPVLVRFENHLDENPFGFNRLDFGSPEWGFLTHLHNGHTAAESDGNPNHRANQTVDGRKLWTPDDPHSRGYLPGEWVDNLYLNWPAGGDDAEKQSFLWFHDHFHNHTGANVYKGMVGLFPIYDPGSSVGSFTFSDMGDERTGLRLPGVRADHPDGSFDVDYDIPLAFYDVRLDDGATIHQDVHGAEYPGIAPGKTHPEWWGQSFFKHFPNHGFVGDIFTVNGTAYPVLEVKRRKYRFRLLDASVSRCYEFKLMSSVGGPKAAKDLGYIGDELQGQYRLPDGQPCMRFTQIARGGGLLPRPLVRDSFELWPAERREVVVDFTTYQDGSPTRKGDVIYLVNTTKMPDGRLPAPSDPAYKVPVLKFVIGDDAPDDSQIPPALRPLPALPPQARLDQLIANRRVFRLERGSDSTSAAENEWLINGRAFDETRDMAVVTKDAEEVWEVQNGGGGWVHPMHMHQEEHRVLSRNGKPAQGFPGAPVDPRHADDTGKDDVVALDPSESVLFYRRFRTFTGKYVAHCHNLAHEDHAMMFGWSIAP